MRQTIKNGYETSDSINRKKPSTIYSPAITQTKGNSQNNAKTPLQNLIYKNIKLNLNEMSVNKHQKYNSMNPPTGQQQQQYQKQQSTHIHGHKGSVDSSMHNKQKLPQTNNAKITFSQPQSIIGSPKTRKREEVILLLQQQLKKSNMIPNHNKTQSMPQNSQNYQNYQNQPQQSLSSQQSQHSQNNQQNFQNEKSKQANFINYLHYKEQQQQQQPRNKNKSQDIQQQIQQPSSYNQSYKSYNNKHPSASSTNNSQQQKESQKEIDEDNQYIQMKNMFHYHYVIGKGGFGKVWKVEHRKSRSNFALKEMSKALIITKKSVPSVMNERNLLSTLKHPFLVNMFFAYQDRDNLYLIMDLMPGGDLRYHIGRQRRFTEEQTRFFVCCIFLSLEYLHNNNIIHRDIKPENLVLDQQGYVRITDLGIARVWKSDNANDTSGTPGYMAPEVMCRQPHTFAVDYFALGVLAYEFMLGRRPYLGRSRKEIRDTILAKRVQIKKQEIPPGWSLEAADFINRMIERKPLNRLGINGPVEVKNHPWIKNFPWEKLERKELRAHFLPSKSDNFDAKQQITVEDEQNADIIAQNALLLKTNSLQSLFNGYNYDGSQLLFQELNSKTPSTQSSSGRMAGQNNHNMKNNKPY